MAHYVMSDIHGEGSRFYAMLDRIGFSSADTLYILGDVIDRGADGVSLLRQILADHIGKHFGTPFAIQCLIHGTPPENR